MSGVEEAMIVSAIIGAGATAYSASQKANIKMPKSPSAMDTGDLVKTKQSDSLNDEDVKKIRETSKKAKTGNSQFQVDLKNKKTGINTTSESGLNT